jgi:hypothetical protein
VPGKRFGLHAERHRGLLQADCPLTRWSRREAERVLGRDTEKLALLPAVIAKARERIIGERPGNHRIGQNGAL